MLRSDISEFRQRVSRFPAALLAGSENSQWGAAVQFEGGKSTTPQHSQE